MTRSVVEFAEAAEGCCGNNPLCSPPPQLRPACAADHLLQEPYAVEMSELGSTESLAFDVAQQRLGGVSTGRHPLKPRVHRNSADKRRHRPERPAFTDFGVENLRELLQIQQEDAARDQAELAREPPNGP